MGTDWTELAALAGGRSRDAYWQETGDGPEADPKGAERWAEAAWAVAWRELRDGGAPESAEAGCGRAWREGFYGIQAVRPLTD
jgi:hypothetical protein